MNIRFPKALLFCLFLAALPVRAQDIAQNPFSGFETHILQNGFKVWFKHMPDQGNVALSVTVGVGSDQDPPGKEQMAHFLEHMQFSDHLGLTTQEIKNQIDSRGGVWNGYTTPERTAYYVHIKKEHALFALDWLFRVLSPHEMKPEVVDRERSPVELEMGAKPRELGDWIGALYGNPPYLRPPGVWKREFGIETNEARDYYLYRSLHSITPMELREFYDRYYSPANMTLNVIGDLDRETVLGLAQKTFATLDQGQAIPAGKTAMDAGRRRETFAWTFRSNIAYTRRIRFAAITANDEVMLTFISRFLGKRLNDRLRFGEEKAVYGVSTGLIKYGPAGYFQISGSIRESEFDFAKRVIDEELEALRRDSHTQEIFEAERSTLIQQLRVSNSTPENLESWALTNFSDRRRHQDFPDVIAVFQNISKAEVSEFVSRNFLPEREFNSTTYPTPLSQGTLGVLAVVFLFVIVRLVRLVLTRPVQMKRIRYVAHFRIPKLLYLSGGAILFVSLAVGLRLLAFVYMDLDMAFVEIHDSVVFQWSVDALMVASMVAAVVLALSLVPSKILVFDDRVLIKYFAYRSVSIRLDEIADLSFQRFPGVWLSRRLWKCIPFKWGIVSPGIYLKAKNGWSYFFDVRDRNELFELLRLN